MKKLYILLLAFVALVFAGQANAKPGMKSNRNMEISAGYINMTTSGNYNVAEKYNLDGFYVGFAYDWKFAMKSWGVWALSPGIKFSYLEDANALDEFALLWKDSLKESYLDIPVYLKYSYKFNYLTLSAFVGPEFSLGMTSDSFKFREKYMIAYDNYTGDQEFKGAKPDEELVPNRLPSYSRYDLKVAVGLGFTFMDRFSLNVGYHIGVLNRYTAQQAAESAITRKTNVFELGLGYRF